MIRFFFFFSLFFIAAYSDAEVKPNNSCSAKIFSPLHSISSDQVSYLPGFGCVTQLQLAGYLPVAATEQKDSNTSRLFYWFVASDYNPSEAPIVLWLNGGPGASSFYGFFTENGPYMINPQGTLSIRDFAWTKKVNYLMIDNPSGVGFSYADPSHPVLSENEATNNLYHAINQFFKRYPEFKHNPLYLSGESYAGKYIPELAVMLHKRDPSIHLQGVIIGDGWVDPEVQQGSVADYAYYHGLIGRVTYQKTRALYQSCVRALHQKPQQLLHANEVCAKVDDFVMKRCGLDRHDIRTRAQIDYAAIPNYLNQAAVRAALHVDSGVDTFTLFSDAVSKNLAAEIQKSDLALYDVLLNAGIPVLIFNGLEDGSDSNFLGAEYWLAKLTWFGSKAFNQTSACIWRSQDKDIAGFVRSSGGLTQIKLRKAGHMAPMDQPAHVLEMLDLFVHKKAFCN